LSIVVNNVSKSFGTFKALDGVNLEAPTGNLVALLGPSGSGKTTLLRIIAGLETADTGSVFFEGENATERSARQRNVGFVFQHYALFRHLTIFENIAFGLRVRKKPEAEVRERVQELLALIQLHGVEKRYPAQLSGGQRQRVALARALAARPKVLLLDEPFGALDARVRKDLRRWLRRLHDEIHVTSLFVTHDQEEALEVADRVVIFNQGKIEQVGTPDEVYDRPANPFVISFLGHVNIFHGRTQSRDVVGAVEAARRDNADRIYARPHEIEISHELPSDGTAVEAKVQWVHRAGGVIKVELEVISTGQLLVVELGRDKLLALNLQTGDKVFALPREQRKFSQDYEI
jgi:sulfate transport system ATP-binding protein